MEFGVSVSQLVLGEETGQERKEESVNLKGYLLLFIGTKRDERAGM